MKNYTRLLVKTLFLLLISLNSSAQFLPCSFSIYPDSVSNSTFYFYSMPAGSAHAYVWDFGDGNTATGNQTMHTYNSTGYFIVCLSELDSLQRIVCTSCDTLVVGPPMLNCNFSIYPDLFDSLTMNFTVTAGPGAFALWDFGDGSTGHGTSASHQYNTPGTYTACLTLTDTTSIPLQTCTQCYPVYVTGGGSGTSCSFTVSHNPAGTSAYLFSGRSSVPGSDISWSFGDGSSGSGLNTSHTYTSPGVFVVCMTETDSMNNVICTYCDSVLVNTNPGNSCSFTYTSNPLNYLEVTFTSQHIPGTTMDWDFGDGSWAIGSNVTHTYNNAGIYNVCNTLTDSLGDTLCFSCKLVNVQSIQPSLCQANFQAVSLGLTGYFIDQSNVNPATASYLWNFGDGHTSASRFPQHQYQSPGTYQVCLDITDSNCTDRFCSTLVVDTTINNPVFCNAFFVPIQMAPYQLVLVDMSSGINLNYHWDFGDGTTSNQHYPSHTYATTGTYVLCLTVSSTTPAGTSCTHSFCDTVSVDTTGNMFRLNQSGFSINVVSPDQLTGVSTIDDMAFVSVWPNPVTDILNLDIDSGGDSEYRVFNVNGAETNKGKLSAGKNMIRTSDWTPGFYMLEITRSDGSRNFLKIVRE